MAETANPKAVVFDFDGTLVDTWRDIATALNRTLRDAGLPEADGPDVRYWIGKGVIDLLERAVPEADRSPERIDELFRLFRDHYQECCLDTTEPYPGVIEVLDELSEHWLAVLSNKPARFLDHIINALGLKSYFRTIVGGDSIDVRKPDPAAFHHVLRSYDGTPAAIWMIGDSAIDVETGLAARANTIGCGWGLRGKQELIDAGVQHLIERPAEIPALVLGRR